MKSNVHNNVICEFDDGRIMINIPAILTPNHIVRPDMLLLKVERRHVDVVRLLDVRYTEDVVYLKIQDQKTGRVGEISSTLDPDERFLLWWVVSYEYFLNHFEDRVYNQIKGMDELLEFDF